MKPTTDDFDQFLQDGCMELAGMWEAAGGRALSPDELLSLNDVLEAFFAARR